VKVIKKFKTEFSFGDSVVLKTDPGTVRIVNGFLLRPGNVTIGLACGENESWHQPGEIMKLQGVFKVKGFGQNGIK